MLLFCVIQACFFFLFKKIYIDKYIDRYIVHLAVKYNRGVEWCYSTLLATNFCLQAHTDTALIPKPCRLQGTPLRKRTVSPHCSLAYVFYIDLISHLIPNTLIIYLFERAICFHHNAYIKASE